MTPAKKAAAKAAKKGPSKVAKKVAAAAVPAPAAPVVPADRSLRFAVNVAKMAVADKCHDVRILDVRGLSPITDYLVLASGSSGRQMRSTADDTMQMGKQMEFRALSASVDSETWICVDFVHVLLHVFNPESRSYYDLEGLWGDAKPVEFVAGPIDEVVEE